MKESVIRTVIPIVYGLLVHYGVLEFLQVDEAVATELITTLVTGLVYFLIRVLEEKVNPLFGWLLGLPKPPQYS